MIASTFNPVTQLIIILLSGFSFSACGLSVTNTPFVQEEMKAPAVAQSTNTALPAAVTGSPSLGSESPAVDDATNTSIAPLKPFQLAATMSPSPTPVTYIVKPGDWLYKIAQLFNITAQELLDANPGIERSNLQVGQELRLPSSVNIEQVSTEEAKIQEIGFAPISPELQSLAHSTFGYSLPIRIEIPVLGIESQVVAVGWHTENISESHKVLWHTPGEAAGFLVSSSAPGQGGNAVFYGHHNIHGNVFRGLDKLLAGDAVRVVNSISVLEYKVESVELFPERDVSAAEKLAHLDFFASTSREQLTILTCWPFETNTHRVVVVARPK